ncbi:enoyl-CoA hydratase/isomerase family protein [Robertmurraya sp. DFI.2.37]|uniref:enoyl-CoA hydratase/isomerase family protein n=1 Tax=Robertmurraya sp. DFI.2.37 TaxID=3031819 RepID=UPI001243E7FE|nr:enoyl-CoA hydratase/isomerase family protein [Robertmurraya sp. DFI.2.37]MDF1506696.1 enoyl-CoA hydratase/isomerase family protein [Robertmurraya sp. DFI.2.37]
MSKSYDICMMDDGLLVFTITRQDKRNAVNFEVMAGLNKAIQLANKPKVKALVITGEGEEAFCSGGDLGEFHQLKTEDQAYQMLIKMGELLYQLVMHPKPTVALLNGLAIGGGCEIATACDIRIARKGIKAGFVQGNLAITTGWGGGTILLERLQHSAAMKMLLEAKVYSCEQLIELGFVQYIYEGDRWEGLRNNLEFIFTLEDTVLIAYKTMFIRKMRLLDLKERIENEIRQCAILWEKDAHHKQVDKFLNKKMVKE